MPCFNRVTLIGNLTRDPQLKQINGGTAVADFGLAMSRKFRTQAGEDREEVCFVDCAAFGKQAEVIGQYCKKGKQLFIEGRLKYDTWDDKVGNGKRSKLSVVVENFQFLGSREDSAHSDGDHEAAGKSEKQPARREGAVGRKAKFQEADIPF